MTHKHMATKEPKAPKVQLTADEQASLEHMQAEEEVIAEAMPEQEAKSAEEHAKVEELRSTIQNVKKAGEDSEERRALARQRRPADE